MSYISGGEDGYCQDDNDRYEAGDDYHNDDGRYQELGMIITMIMIIIRQCQRRSTGLQGICHSCLSSFLLRATSTMKRFSNAIAIRMKLIYLFLGGGGGGVGYSGKILIKSHGNSVTIVSQSVDHCIAYFKLCKHFLLL